MAEIQYAAQVQHVREVALSGTGDLGWWERALKAESLVPLSRDGRARLLITGTDLKFAGIRFHELCVAVFARADLSGGAVEGLYLAHAFHSNRFFAWIERAWFKAPYYPSTLGVFVDPPRIETLNRTGGDFRTSFRRPLPDRPAESEGPAGWRGPVWLPGRPAQLADDRYWFYGKVEGQTKTWKYDRERDEFDLPAKAPEPIFAALAASGFQPEEWSVREDAFHAKSKTYRRRDWAGLKIP